MALKITAFSLILILLLPIISYPQPMGMKPWRKDARCWKAAELNLSLEQTRGLNIIQETYFRDLQLLRAQLITKRLEFRELLTNPAVRMDSIRMKYIEATETQSKMEEKAMEYLVKVRGLLSHEQLKLWCPEQEFPFFQRMMPGHGPMGPMSPKKMLPPEE